MWESHFYIFFDSALVMSRDLGDNPSTNKKKEANYYFAMESAGALFISYLINLSIVVVFAQVFYNPGQAISHLPGLYDASEVLAKTLGKSAKYFWALGLLAAGQCSTMTGTLAGQYVSIDQRKERERDLRTHLMHSLVC